MKNKNLIYVLILVFLPLVLFSPLFKAYYQQDEWLAFNRLFILAESTTLEKIKNIFIPTSGHYTPLNLLVLLFEFTLFKIKYEGYLLASLVLHIICTLLFFKLAKRLVSDNFLSFLMALLFAVLSSTFQATAWVIADVGTHMSTMLTLISLIFFQKFIEIKENKHFVYSLLFLVVSFLFKEISLATLLVYSIGILLLRKKRDTKFILPLIVLFGFVVLRFMLNRSDETILREATSQSSTFYSLITFPFKTYFQTLVPGQILIDASRIIAKIVYKLIHPELVLNSWQFDVFVEYEVFEFIVVGFGLVILGLLIKLIIKNWKSKTYKIALFWIIFSSLNALIFSISPEKTGRLSVFESRNLYLISVGVIFSINLVLYKFIENKKILYFLILCFIFFNAFLTIRDSTSLAKQTGLRKQVLSQILYENPSIKSKTIFYTESNTSYFGLPENIKIMPFQSGFGQTLIVNYHNIGDIGIDFLKNRYLWELQEQGYKEIGNQGFGYFREKELLINTIRDKNLDEVDIIAYSWDGSINMLVNITKNIKEELKINVK